MLGLNLLKGAARGGAIANVLRLLTRRVGNLPNQTIAQINTLSLEQLEKKQFCGSAGDYAITHLLQMNGRLICSRPQSLAKQMALETIAELTGLTLEQLQQLQANQPQN